MKAINNKNEIFDTIVIGAGVVGACVAHTLTQKKQKVLVLEKKGVALGASGSAGAFVSPKIGKASPLHTLTNEAFVYARDFYCHFVPKHFHQTGVLRIAKDENDSQKFSLYEEANQTEYEKYNANRLKKLQIKSQLNSFYFADAGVCDAVEVCNALLKDIEVKIHTVKSLTQKDNLWHIGVFKAKNIVLATGYETDLIPMDYMGIHGVWGTRGDFKTALHLPLSIHQSLSIGTTLNGIIKLGATHQRTIKKPIKCQKEESLKLQSEASKLVDTTDFVLKESFCGMRSSSKDSFPLAGKIIDVEFMLKNYPLLLKGQKKPLEYLKNLYICNGVGGRGFVFAPLMAKILSEQIVENRKIDERVNPDRLFFKWCRKRG